MNYNNLKAQRELHSSYPIKVHWLFVHVPLFRTVSESRQQTLFLDLLQTLATHDAND
jgi:hypothetical protein